MKKLHLRKMPSPVGELKLVANEESLLAILWDEDLYKEHRVRLEEMQESNHPLLLHVEKQLQEYFAHQRDFFTLPLRANGTPFQQAVWKVLLEIPYGVTWSYKQVAEKIGQPKAVRAVGAAIGRNPISIIIPCHRVIGVNGKLTGFAGGLDKKETLLRLESDLKNKSCK